MRLLLREDVDPERLARRLTDTAAARPWQRGLFSFLRELQGLQRGPIEDPSDLCRVTAFRPLLALWYRTACLDLVALDDVLARATDLWPRITRPAGGDVLAEAVREMNGARSVLPAELLDCDDTTRELAALCLALARHPKNVEAEIFFLSARTAAGAVGTDAMTASRRLKLLRELGAIAQMEPGRPGRAARYRWLGCN